jgi:hypothetical protein
MCSSQTFLCVRPRKRRFDGPFTIILLFCAIGLLASLSRASLSFDVNGGFF